MPKYPDVSVQLTRMDGNAFMIIGAVRKALRLAGASEADLEEFADEAMSGNYDDLIRTAIRWVNVS